jgi:hypothetical protein
LKFIFISLRFNGSAEGRSFRDPLEPNY